jgi:hypothetical protein
MAPRRDCSAKRIRAVTEEEKKWAVSPEAKRIAINMKISQRLEELDTKITTLNHAITDLQEWTYKFEQRLAAAERLADPLAAHFEPMSHEGNVGRR